MRRRELLGGAAVIALLFAALFWSDGTSEDRIFWLGGAAILLAGGAGAAALAGLLPLPRLDRAGVAFLVALAGLVVWAGISLSWSIVADRSWAEFDRGLAYLAFAVVGVLLGALATRPRSLVAAVLAALLCAVCVWALLGDVFPTLYAEPPGSPVTRLRNPVGYWNALALLADAAMPLALWLAASRRVRAAGALLLYVAAVTVLLTYSRTGVVVGGLLVVAWMLLAGRRLEGLTAAIVALPAALGVSLFAFTRSGLKHFHPHSARVHDGAWFGLVLLAGALVVALAISYMPVPPPERRRSLERRIGLALAAGVTVAVVGLAFRAGGPAEWWREFTNPQEVTQGSGRLGSASSNNRWTWWNEAWRLFEAEPLRGKGAGSFAVARRPIRHNAIEVLEPHNTALQFLSELGIVGFLLGAAAAAAAFVLARRAARAGPAALALALGLVGYGLHALVDFDWEFLAATGTVLFVAGVLAGAGRPAAVRRRRVAPAGIAVVVALAALYSLGAPWLASHRVDSSYAALDRGDVEGAISDARSAHRLNPLSYEPYWALAGAALGTGDGHEALVAYEKAAILQPENSDTWYALGQYEFETGRYARACYALDLAYRLDPRGPAGDPGGLLDRVKKRLPGCPGARR